jgi:hypothetical protein
MGGLAFRKSDAIVYGFSTKNELNKFRENIGRLKVIIENRRPFPKKALLWNTRSLK